MALFFTGIILVVVNQLIKANARPVPVQYTYLPRDLDTYLREQPLASAEFLPMFREEDVTLGRG